MFFYFDRLRIITDGDWFQAEGMYFTTFNIKPGYSIKRKRVTHVDNYRHEKYDVYEKSTNQKVGTFTVREDDEEAVNITVGA